MKRRSADAPPVRVYTYGLPTGPTPDCAAAVDEQLRRAHRFKNDLIAIERARREAYTAIVGEAPSVAELDARIAEMVAERAALRAETQRARAEARRRIEMPTDAAKRIAELKALIKQARAERRAARAASKDPRIELCNARAAEMVRLHHLACGLRPSGTYLHIEKAVEATRKGRPPKFRRWDGSGRIVVQTTARGTNGLPVPALLAGADNRIRIDLVPQVRRTKRHPEGIAVPNSALLRMRVGEAREWASFPVIMHRPLPEDGIVKWAWVQRRRIGTRWRWELQIVLEAPSFATRPRAGHAVAVDFGAKGKHADRLVALAVGTDGEVHRLRLPDDEPRAGGRVKRGTHAALAHVDSLRAIRDRNFNDSRETLLDWLAESDPPTWLAEAVRWMPQWRSPKRLVRLVHAWREQRFEGDETIFAALDAWRRQDRHLYQWESDERAKALARRREVARTWAAELARKYAHLVTEDVDLARMRRNAAPEAPDASRDRMHRTAAEAAPGEARDAVRHAFAARETRLKPTGRAKRCASCGGAVITSEYEAACTACGMRIDADYARCWGLLRDAGHGVEALAEKWRAGQALAESMKGMVRR